MARPAAMDVRRLRRRLLGWYERHGRKDLPWKRSRDPYRVWVSEIMLQQTQVSTVIPYYARFLKRFPDLRSLARADLDSVLHHWTGLGYYARARNLKRAAEVIVDEHGGRFPHAIEQVCALPGIGRSTAGAILAFAYDQCHPILDGNVKRVLARLHAIASPVTQRNTEETLWALAEVYTPDKHVSAYTQAIMDLGATICRPRNPDCALCPLATDCRAHALGSPEKFPVRVRRKTLPVKRTLMLMIRDARGRVLLTQRPPTGLWGGLWGFPECAPEDSVPSFCRSQFGLKVRAEEAWPVLRHGFSHFHLHITPIPARLTGTSATAMETAPAVWYNPRKPDARGLAAPVKQLLQQLRNNE
jgi:A/G-specific adenine glycosylase